MDDRSYRNRILAGSVGLLALLGVVALIVGRPAANKPTLTQTAISAADANRAASETASAPPTAQPTTTPTPPPAEDRVWFQSEGITIYTLDNRLCLLRTGEQPVYLADAIWLTSVKVSTDQRSVAFVKSPPAQENPDFAGYEYDELWIVAADGADRRLLLSTRDNLPVRSEYIPQKRPYAEITVLEWIPGTHQLALTTDYFGHLIAYSNDLYLADANSNAVTMLLAPGSGGGSFAISPDGRQIAIVTAQRNDVLALPNTISFIKTDGSNWQQDVFAFEPIITYSAWYFYVATVWAPDSTGVWVAIPEYSGDHTMDAWYIPAGGSSAALLMRWNPVYRLLGDNVPTFSPDGAYIAFVGKVGEDGESGLHFLSVDGIKDILYYSGDVRFLQWEDATHFIFQMRGQSDQSRFRGEIGGGYETLPMPVVPQQGCTPGS